MQTFQFNFGLPEQDAHCGDQNAVVKSDACLFQPRLNNAVDGKRFVQIVVSHSTQDDVSIFKVYKVHIETAEAAAALALDDIALADVVPGQYEGGFKLWEGAQDLMDVIVHRVVGPWPTGIRPASLSLADSSMMATLPSTLQGTRVLELGCGHGLPGILCMLAGAEVVFHDLNKGVIEMATFANVIKNATVSGQGETDTHLQARFIDGDFISASDVLCSTLGCRRFDLILTAESIYNPTSVPQLLAAFNRCLSPAGVILVAAKSYYFGVGGGVASFKKAIDADGLFKCAVLARVDDGKSNIREVLLLRRI